MTKFCPPPGKRTLQKLVEIFIQNVLVKNYPFIDDKTVLNSSDVQFNLEVEIEKVSWVTCRVLHNRYNASSSRFDVFDIGGGQIELVSRKAGSRLGQKS